MALDELHRDRRGRPVLDHVVDRDDVGMLQRAGGGRFAVQPAAELLRLFILLGERNRLQRHGTADGRIEAFGDDSHRPAAKLRLHLIPADEA